MTTYSNDSCTSNGELINDFSSRSNLSHSSCQANSNCKLLHANVVSIVKNINKLEQLIQEIKVQPEIIGITETKLKDHFKHKPTITGYTFINKNSLTNAGGVGFLSDQIYLSKL